jgi:hypothetical protein
LKSERVGKGRRVVEPGLDLHEWETRWQELQDLAADDPQATLPEMVRFVEQILAERGMTPGVATAEADDGDVARDFLAARDVATAVEAGGADPGDVAAALESLRDVYAYVAADRAAP